MAPLEYLSKSFSYISPLCIFRGLLFSLYLQIFSKIRTKVLMLEVSTVLVSQIYFDIHLHILRFVVHKIPSYIKSKKPYYAIINNFTNIFLQTTLLENYGKRL